MLSFFRRNLFINLVFLFLFVLGLQGYFFIEWTAPPLELSMGIDEHQLPEFFSDHIFQSILTILLIFIQAIMISRFVIEHKMSRALSYIPGAVFILYASFVLENFSFHFILLANLFFIMAVGNLYDIYKEFRPVAHIFNAGFFLSIASLIYFPYLLMFLVILMGLVSLRKTSFTEVLQLIIGVLAGYFLTGVTLYATGHLDWFVSIFVAPQIPDIDWSNASSWIKPGMTLAIILVLLFFHRSVEKKRTYDAIRKIDLNFWFLLFGLISLLFVRDPSLVHLMVVSFPIALLGGLVLERKEYAMTKEFIFLLALGFYFTLVFQLI